MAKEPGTLEALALALARLLQPLEVRLQAKQFRLLFAEFGLLLPPEVDDLGGLRTEAGKAASAAGELPPLVGALVDAVEAEDFGAIARTGKDLFAKTKRIFDAVRATAAELRAVATSVAGVPPAAIHAFADGLPRALVDYLVIRHLEGTPGLADGLEFVGIVERTEKALPGPAAADPQTYTERVLHPDRLIDFINDPNALLRELYGWDTPTFDGALMLQHAARLLTTAGLPAVYDDTVSPPTLDVLAAEAFARTDLQPRGLTVVVNERFPVTGDYTFARDDWQVQMGLAGDVQVGTELVIQPNDAVTYVQPHGSVDGEAYVAWTGSGSEPTLVLGQVDASRLEAQTLAVKVGVDFTSDTSGAASGVLFVVGEVRGGKLVIDTSDSDGFLASVLPAVNAEFDIGLRFSMRDGWQLRGSGALELELPIHRKLGPIDLQAIILGIRPGGGTIPITIGATVAVTLGPFRAVIQDIGFRANFAIVDGVGGNLGPLDVSLGFKFPKGVGLSLKAPAVRGSGFLSIDADKGEYAGVAELAIYDLVTVNAIGIINTKLPTGESGFSLLLLVAAEFAPVQLSFGFTLNGVGGLIGANRSLNLEALRNGVRQNTLDDLLFPDNLVANAPQIISSMNSAFPIAVGQHSFGFMGIIGWGTPTLITIELGLMIEVPDPVRLALLGVLKALLPDEDAAVLRLQVNFVGTVDFERGLLTFDASLFDSRLLSITLSGEMAFRLKWGEQPNFLLSVGGFHPAYEPPPLSLPDLRPITLNLLGGSNPRLLLTSYFAVTSNTVQFGASIDFLFKVSKFKVVGWFSFDALFQFSPFYFNVSISAGLAVKLGSSTILGVSVSGTLEGPTPWRVRGTGSFRILFLKFRVGFDKTFGDRRDTTLPGIAVLPKLLEALDDNRNWQAAAAAGSRLLATFRAPLADEESAGRVVLHPFGALSVSQRVVPLDLTIDKLGHRKPSDHTHFSLAFADASGDLATTDLKEFFAPAQYLDLSDAEKLSRKAYERYNSGLLVALGDDLHTSSYREREVEYEVTVIDTSGELPRFQLREVARFFRAWTKGTSIARSPLGVAATKRKVAAAAKVTVNAGDYVVVQKKDLVVVDGTIGKSEAEATAKLRAVLAEHPEREDELQVVEMFEAA